MSHREEASGKTQDTLEKLCLSAGLGTPRGPPGRARRKCLGLHLLHLLHPLGPGPGRGGSSLSRDAQTSLTPDTSSSSSGGTLRRSQASRET
ncbi:hypothetical protein L3Q82_014175 [Scortum barcoo]|uniref:Uncharacterized protein n=1 Tax=Scortum barcoo TaxID=214431 RepID=A0ACB8VWC8_9TELE|nr:hypothetical protein L3Q82_014175 [Scortum barcoo]